MVDMKEAVFTNSSFSSLSATTVTKKESIFTSILRLWKALYR